jgi:hypothetical protein
MRLAQRLRALEKRVPAQPTFRPYPPFSESLTERALLRRFAEMQERATLGDPEATWRVERLHLLFERARERQRNEHQNPA